MRGWSFFDMDSAMAKRAALGIEVRSTGTSRDTLGVFVDAVTPKGPAESAGVVEGDRIAAINGVDLRTSSADAEDSYTSGLASHRLTREVQKLAPGARVSLRVYSGGRVRDVQVTAGKASDVMRLSSRFGPPGMEGMMRFGGPGGGMIYGQEMPKMLERLKTLPNDQLLRERLRDLPQKIQLRAPMRYKTLSPLRTRAPQIYKVENDAVAPDISADTYVISDNDEWPELDESWSDELDEPFSYEFDAPFAFDLDDEPFEVEDDIEPVSADVIRELAATTIRDARVALERLAAAGIV
jgi:hypothetical protein